MQESMQIYVDACMCAVIQIFYIESYLYFMMNGCTIILRKFNSHLIIILFKLV